MCEARRVFVCGLVLVIIACAATWPLELFDAALVGIPILLFCQLVLVRYCGTRLAFDLLTVVNGLFRFWIHFFVNKSDSSPATWLAKIDVGDFDLIVLVVAVLTVVFQLIHHRLLVVGQNARFAIKALGYVAFAVYGTGAFLHWIDEFRSYIIPPISLLPTDVPTFVAMFSTAAFLVFVSNESQLVLSGEYFTQLIIVTASSLDLASTSAVVAAWLVYQT